ncbi:hypothetical protein BDQ17DRAFT_1340616 [Cyathus striatus]|nr:hypothetical protein BDQ17DRAFT_1340616 [Cyathus striatus]
MVPVRIRTFLFLFVRPEPCHVVIFTWATYIRNRRQVFIYMDLLFNQHVTHFYLGFDWCCLVRGNVLFFGGFGLSDFKVSIFFSCSYFPFTRTIFPSVHILRGPSHAYILSSRAGTRSLCLHCHFPSCIPVHCNIIDLAHVSANLGRLLYYIGYVCMCWFCFSLLFSVQLRNL